MIQNERLARSRTHGLLRLPASQSASYAVEYGDLGLTPSRSGAQERNSPPNIFETNSAQRKPCHEKVGPAAKRSHHRLPNYRPEREKRPQPTRIRPSLQRAQHQARKASRPAREAHQPNHRQAEPPQSLRILQNRDRQARQRTPRIHAILVPHAHRLRHRSNRRHYRIRI